MVFWLLDGRNQAAPKKGGVGAVAGGKCSCRLAKRATDVEARQRRQEREGRGGGGGTSASVAPKKTLTSKRKSHLPRRGGKKKTCTLISPRMLTLALVTQPQPSFASQGWKLASWSGKQQWPRACAHTRKHRCLRAYTLTHTREKSAEMPHPCKVCVSASYA